MTALTTTPVQAAAITARLTDKLPVSEPCPLGDITIAADDERPEDHWVGKPGERVAEVWTSEPFTGPTFETSLTTFDGASLTDHPVPVGRVACTATVTARLPIVGRTDSCPRGWDGPLVEVDYGEAPSDGVVVSYYAHCDDVEPTKDITADTVWQPEAWAGGWVLVLANITPAETP